MDITILCSMDMIDRSFNITCFEVDRKYNLMRLSLIKLRSYDVPSYQNIPLSKVRNIR
jgi:hypothetical protein